MSLNPSEFSPGAPLSKKEQQISKIEHARLLNPLRAHVEAKAAAAVEKNEDLNPTDSLHLILIEGDFEVPPQERLELDTLQKDLAAIDARILETTLDPIKEKHRADSLKGPQPLLEDVVESARKFRSKLKVQRMERVAKFAPIGREIVQRALHVIEGTAGIVHEREKDTAAAYGFAFFPSHTLNRLNNAGAQLREVLGVFTKSPDFADTAFIERLTAGFGPAE